MRKLALLHLGKVKITETQCQTSMASVTIGQQASVNNKVRKFPARGHEISFEKK